MTDVMPKPDVRPRVSPGSAITVRPPRRRGLARLGRPSIYVAVIIWMTATLGPYIVMMLTSLIPQSQLIAPAVAYCRPTQPWQPTESSSRTRHSWPT
jgi:ABC-type glycerol-3-phosphate transport system permease component